MKARERVRMLLNREIPDKMGIYEHFWGETIPKWKNEGYPEDTDPRTYFGFDLQPVEGSGLNTELRPGYREVIEETDRWEVRKDGRGATLKYWKEKSGTPEHIDFEVTSREIWEEWKQPLKELDPDRIDLETLTESLPRQKEGTRFVFFGQLVFFELLRGTLGDVCMLENLLLDPDWIHDFCQTYLDFFRRHYEYIFREVGRPDGMFIYEDLGFTNGPFCSPQTYREVIFPYHRELFGFFHDYDLPVILHSCGDVRRLVPDLIQTGIDCLQPMEAKAGLDVCDLAREFGDAIAYMGNIDVTVLNRNDLREVEEEVRRKVDFMRSERIPYFFHSDHSIPPDIDFKTYRRALDIFAELRSYR